MAKLIPYQSAGKKTILHTLTGMRARNLRTAKAIIVRDGEELLDVSVASAVSGRAEGDILAAAQKAAIKIQEVDLAELISNATLDIGTFREEMEEFGLCSRDGQKVLWGKGLAHPSEIVRKRFTAICRVLVETAASRVGEMGIPVQALNCDRLCGEKRRSIEPVFIDEIRSSLRGLYAYFVNHRGRGNAEVMDFMLEALGLPVLADLSITEQVEVIGRMGRAPWRKLPLPLQRFLVSRLAENVGCSPWHLNARNFQDDNPFGDRISLWGLYQAYQNQLGRNGQEIIDFMLEQMGFGLPPFNPTGSLFLSTPARYPLQSLHAQLQATRELVRLWQQEKPGASLTGVRRLELERILRRDARFTGFRNLLQGVAVNPFGLTFIDLICRAFQHMPLDAIDPTYRAAHPDEPNYLRPDMFTQFEVSKAQTQVPRYVTGTYTRRGRGAELPLLDSVLDEQIAIVRARNSRAKTEEETFDPKWLETQRRMLEQIENAIAEGRPLSWPLAFAVGVQTGASVLQPRLVDQKQVREWGLNPSQTWAARMMLSDENALSAVHGPYGSGKTHVLLPVIEALVRSGKKVLYATPTHKAADVFMARVSRTESYRRLPVLRLGISKTGLSEVAREYWVRRGRSRADFRDKSADSWGGGLFVSTIAGGTHFLIDEAARLTRQSLFSEHVGRGSRVKIVRDIDNYDVVIIDEASMASKPEVYALLSLARRGVVIGDHIQLEPFEIPRGIINKLGLNEYQAQALRRSLLEELMLANYPHVLLDTNYRAINPSMMLLASRLFYDERVRANPDSPFFNLSRDSRMRKYPAESLLLMDTSALPYATRREWTEGTSYSNLREVRLLMSEIRRRRLNLRKVSFITPYAAQVALIRRSLARGFPREASTTYLNHCVSTFMGFQGDENDFGALSFVRSNQGNPPETGFVGDPHQVNVGLTRWHRGMIAVGDLATLQKTGTGEREPELTSPVHQETRFIFTALEQQLLELESDGMAEVRRLP